MSLSDISANPRTLRTAIAAAGLHCDAAAIVRLREGALSDLLPTARVAAVQAAKNASQLIPSYHPAPIEYAGIDFTLGADRINITATVKAIHRTGVEMQALTAVTIAALTLYDMLKATVSGLSIEGIILIANKGDKEAPNIQAKAGILVISDSVAAGTKADGGGIVIRQRLEDFGVTIAQQEIIPDDAAAIARIVTSWCDDLGLDLIVTTGGTGLGPRDVTPDAVEPLLARRLSGVEEAMRAHGQERVATAMLSRSLAGQRGATVVVCLPGSPKGVAESLDAILPALLHTIPIMTGGGH